MSTWMKMELYAENDRCMGDKIFKNHKQEKCKSSVANSGRSSVIADRLRLLVGQNRCRFLKITEHN